MERNLNKEEAIKKYKELVEDIKICMFISSTEETQSARPMMTIRVDDDGTTWFFTSHESGKVQEVEMDHTVRLLYAHPGKSSYMDVWGYAEIVTDKDKMHELWNPVVKAWFPDGVDDPNLCLLKIEPQLGHYWDNESGKMVQFMKILTSAATGKQVSQGVQGTLKP